MVCFQRKQSAFFHFSLISIVMYISGQKLRHGPKALSLRKVRGWSISKGTGHENLKLWQTKQFASVDILALISYAN